MAKKEHIKRFVGKSKITLKENIDSLLSIKKVDGKDEFVTGYVVLDEELRGLFGQTLDIEVIEYESSTVYRYGINDKENMYIHPSWAV